MPATASFVRDLHRALTYLYEPAVLRQSPLAEIFSLQSQHNPVSALQCALLEAIESLKPAPETPLQSGAWRSYRILFHRYTEQCTQVEVAGMLGFSERQLRREEHVAVRALAEYLWHHYGVELRAPALAAPSAAAETGTPSREQELEWLQKSLAPATSEVAEVIGATLRVANALAQELRVRMDAVLPATLPQIAMEPGTMRQALLNALTPAIRAVPHGAVQISVDVGRQEITIRLRPCSHPAYGATLSPDVAESLEMARQLLALGGGSLTVSQEQCPQYPFTISLTLPLAERAAVLAIDDNVDTLQLFQRCLAGTRYPFIGAHDPEQALRLVEKLRPRIIILDLMLPGLDGWEVLGRLRAHPRTHSIPIVVCSILPQEQLALALGAAAFIRKPVSRAALLSTLDRLTSGKAS